jgi:putative pyrroloquinoline-quinone binding quinoprotein
MLTVRVCFAALAGVLVLAMSGPTADARGEASYRLPEVREAVAPAAQPLRMPRWERDAAPPRDGNFQVSMLAFADDSVVFAHDGRVCAFAELSGARLWCAGGGGRPAFAGGLVAYVHLDGTVRCVDARNGTERWRFRFPVAAGRAAEPGGPRIFSPEQFVWPTKAGFLVGGGSSAPNYGELSRFGRVLWSTELVGSWSAPTFAYPYVLEVVSGSGGGFQATVNVVRLGAGGGPVAQIRSAIEVLDVSPPLVVVRGDQAGEHSEPFLAFDVFKADLLSGIVGLRYRYEPDYDANYDQVRKGMLNNQSPGKIALDGDMLYLDVASRVYRYTFADGASQRPLLVSADGVHVGGPYRGTVYVARGDGVWALTPDVGRIRARLVAPSRTKFQVMAIDGRTAYFGFDDGNVRGVGLEGGGTTFEARTCVPARIGTTPGGLYVVCSAPRWKVVAFARS